MSRQDTKKRVWIGPAAEIERCLNGIRADMENGYFRLVLPGNDKVLSFLQNDEQLMVTSGMTFYLNGEPMSLYRLMASQGKASEPAIELGED